MSFMVHQLKPPTFQTHKMCGQVPFDFTPFMLLRSQKNMLQCDNFWHCLKYACVYAESTVAALEIE
jgi:hypothetical protein